MPQELAQKLADSIAREVPGLRAIPEEQAAAKPARDGAWSRRQELGHLIDSAANNHLRFVKASLQSEFHGDTYAQDSWVALHGYSELRWSMLLEFWERYNRLSVELIARIPEDKLATSCFIGANPPVTLGFVIEDYILHMQHHLDHILGREKLTQYPGAAVGV